VLLSKTVKVFPNYFDFLDGDIYFRKHNGPVDIFVDKKRDLTPLTVKPVPDSRRNLGDMEWESQGKVVIPGPYDFASVHRAPVVKLGYFAFSQDGGSLLFEGPRVGEAPLGLSEFLAMWKKVKNDIKTPFIALHSANENWGLLSTYYPNRTVDWGICCGGDTKDLMEFLDHPMTLMLAVGQHSNITHPKIVTLPRGMPIWKDFSKRLIWDTMREVLRLKPKNQLVFTAASSWGPRPQILACVAKKFSVADFKGVAYHDSRGSSRLGPGDYLQKLGRARMGLALSGLGTDTFRWQYYV
jgi:hypothetical protein